MSKIKSALNNEFIFLPFALCIIDLAYTRNTADPLNPIKFWLLGIVALFVLSSMVSQKNTARLIRSNKILKLSFIISAFFLISLVWGFYFTDVKSVGLIGFYGRNNGVLSYIFLVLLFIFSFLNFRSNSMKPFYKVIGSLCLLFSIYGAFQHVNLDFVHWDAPYNKITLTLGNSDFSAALLGIFVAIQFALLFTKVSRQLKLLICASISFTTLVIYWTNARQGLMAVALGIGIVLTIVVWQKNHRAAIALITVELIAGGIAILGMLQIGPLAKYLYKSSINDRGYDWRAGWHMFTSHPWTGIGIDRYAGYFLQYRQSKYPLIYGYQQSVNNSHNIFIEFFATGGIFLGVSYIILILFIGMSGLRALKRSEGNEQVLISGIFAGWVVFVAQSIISVDNLGIAIWGWVLGGILVGLSINIKREHDIEYLGNQRILQKATLFSVLILLFSCVIIPMYQGQTRMLTFKKIALPDPNNQSQRTVYGQIADATFRTPLLCPEDKVLIAFSITNGGSIDQGAAYFQEILNADPRRSDAAQFLGTIYESEKNYTKAIYNRSIAQKLDPWGAPNLVLLAQDYMLAGDKSSARKVRDLVLAMAPGTHYATKVSKAITD